MIWHKKWIHMFFKNNFGVHRYRLWWQNNTEPRLGNLWEKAYWFVFGTCQLPFCTPARLRLRWPRFEGDEGRRSRTFESRYCSFAQGEREFTGHLHLGWILMGQMLVFLSFLQIKTRQFVQVAARANARSRVSHPHVDPITRATEASPEFGEGAVGRLNGDLMLTSISWYHQIRWVCLKIGYTPNYSHLIGIMISKTIGFRGTNHFQTHPDRHGCFLSHWTTRSHPFLDEPRSKPFSVHVKQGALVRVWRKQNCGASKPA